MITIYEYIRNYFKIVNKEAKLVSLEPNSAQKRLYEIFRECFNSNRPCKIITLKARQLGISTMTEAIMSAISFTNFNTNSLIVAHIPQSTSNIYNMCRRYYENLPDTIRPMIKYSNVHMLSLENPTQDILQKKRNPGLNSSVVVSTAGSAGIGRGSTYLCEHLSEVAFWPDEQGMTVQDQITGLLQCLPQHGFSFVNIESTANGYNYFKTLWDKAEAGESEFIPLFIPWFEMEEYRLKYTGFQLTDAEIRMKEIYGLDDDQITWRRYAIDTLCGGDIDKFRQEYPCNPEEAFLLSGRPVFNNEMILQRLQEVKPAAFRGIFNSKEELITDSSGPIEIWKKPEKGHVYAIAADTAGEGSDYFVAYAVDQATLEQVAKYRTQVDEYQFVIQLMALGHYYNYAMLGPETNFSTYPTMKLQELGYQNLYVREVEDTYLSKVTKKFGFRTTSVTRPVIIGMLVEFVIEHLNKINDRDLLLEMLSFVKNDVGRPEAASGQHDDCVMAFAIACYILGQARPHLDPKETQDQDYSGAGDVQSFLNFGG